MTTDNKATYYDLDINGTTIETRDIVRAVLERAGLGADASHQLGKVLERCIRLGAKPGTDVPREVEKIAIEAGMLRDAVRWNAPLREVIEELREVYKKTDWAKMDDPIAECHRLRYGDDAPAADAEPITDDDAEDACRAFSRETAKHLGAVNDLYALLNEARARIAELERERDDYRRLYETEAAAGASLRDAVTVADRARDERDRWRQTAERAQADLNALRTTLETERQAAVATAEELERVRKELADLRDTYDAEMEFRVEMRDELGARDDEGFSDFLRRVCRELAAIRDRYRERKQVEEKAPEGEVVLVRGCRGKSWSACWGENVADSAFWTRQPPAPGEGE